MASSFFGPTTFTPSFERASATPLDNGFSGPIIHNEIFFSLAYFTIISGLFISRIISSLLSSEIPGLKLEAAQ